MKKTFFAITLIATSLFISCKKEKQVTNQPTEISKSNSSENSFAKEFNLTLSENRLVFKTVDDYKKAIDNPTEEVAKKFKFAVNNFTNFKSYLSFKNSKKIKNTDDLFNDPYFEAILNSDKVVQIGNFIYRINPLSQKVFVLPSKNSSEYNDLVNENTNNSNIKVYSTGDNVLELVENNTVAKSTALFCGEGGIGGYADGVDFSYNNQNRRAAVDFNRYGIYFSLFARIWPSTGSSEFTFDFNGTLGYIHYHVRCGSTADYGTLSGGNQNGNGEQRYQSYQGSTNLNNMFFAFTPRANSTNTTLSRMVVIRANW